MRTFRDAHRGSATRTATLMEQRVLPGEYDQTLEGQGGQVTTTEWHLARSWELPAALKVLHPNLRYCDLDYVGTSTLRPMRNAEIEWTRR